MSVCWGDCIKGFLDPLLILPFYLPLRKKHTEKPFLKELQNRVRSRRFTPEKLQLQVQKVVSWSQARQPQVRASSVLPGSHSLWMWMLHSRGCWKQDILQLAAERPFYYYNMARFFSVTRTKLLRGALGRHLWTPKELPGHLLLLQWEPLCSFILVPFSLVALFVSGKLVEGRWCSKASRWPAQPL